MTTTPLNPRAIPRAIHALSRSRRTKWDRSPTRSGCDVTRITDDATLTRTDSIFREPIHRVKWDARITPTPAMRASSLREMVWSGLRGSSRANGARIRDASARRYRAIVMKGEVDHEMKIAENDTDTTARAIPAYGPPRIEPGSGSRAM